ncbi:DNA replication protein [Citrobacter braakii]|nr:DNA replication protein [Citrobacter braakii]
MAVVKLADYRRSECAETSQGAANMGFVYLHRQFMDSKLYKDSQAVHLWLHLILKANHADTVVMTDIGEMIVGRGQMITGRPTLVMETFIPDNKVRSLLRTFESKGMIKTESKERKFSLITICKYDDFQTQNCPTNVQRLSNATPHPERAEQGICPTNVQRLSINNNITNNSLTNVRESASSSENADQKKPSLSCEQVVDVYSRILPEAQGINILTDKRRNMIRTFWQKASKVTRQLDGHPFTLNDWEVYLNYIATNCRWMLENRPDQRTGKTWRKKSLEFFLNVDVYARTREGACDDL